MSKSSSRQEYNILPSISKRSSSIHSSSRHSPLKLRPPSEKCRICTDDSIATACLNCLNLQCINCAIQHSKDFQAHQVCSLREAYAKVTDNVKQMEGKLKKIAQMFNLTPVSQRPAINYNMFELSISQIRSIHQQVQSNISSFFERITNEYINMWNSFLEIWGSGSALLDRISSTQAKLHQFLNPEHLNPGASLSWFFREMVYQEGMQIIESLERREQADVENETDELLFPPRAVIDLSSLARMEQMLHQMIQILDWQMVKQPQHKITPSVAFPRSIPIIPVGSKFMYLYDSETKEYQVGDFQDLRQQQIPYYNKSVLSETGELYLVGGADSKGLPSKALLLLKDGELTNLAPMPKGKNPTNGLILDGEKIYVIGGLRVEDGKLQWTKSCEIYLIKENKWISIEPMLNPKPNQSVFKIQKHIYAIGASAKENVTFERLNLEQHFWTNIKLPTHSINPFQFGGGYTAVAVNENQVLFFGGKGWSKQSEDDDVLKAIFCYDLKTKAFQCLGEKLVGNGVSFGDFNPIVAEGKVIHFESPISKVRRLHRWTQFTNVVEIKFSEYGVESEIVQVMTPD